MGAQGEACIAAVVAIAERPFGCNDDYLQRPPLQGRLLGTLTSSNSSLPSSKNLRRTCSTLPTPRPTCSSDSQVASDRLLNTGCVTLWRLPLKAVLLTGSPSLTSTDCAVQPSMTTSL